MGHEFRYLFTPITVGPITLKNRIYSTGHAEAMAEGGMPGERMRAYHEEKARGGLGLTIIGVSTSVHPTSPAAEWNLIANHDDAIIPHRRRGPPAGPLHRRVPRRAGEPVATAAEPANGVGPGAGGPGASARRVSGHPLLGGVRRSLRPPGAVGGQGRDPAFEAGRRRVRPPRHGRALQRRSGTADRRRGALRPVCQPERHQLMAGGTKRVEGKLVEGPADQAAERIVAFLRERGFIY